MKTTFKIALALMLSFSLMSSTCSSSDDDGSNNSGNTQAVVDVAQSGSWIISYYFDTDHEETDHFTGYTFTFGSNGVLTAVNGGTTVTGTWSVTNSSSSSDDDGSSDLDFNINFSSPADFAELSDDWDILQISSNQIQLVDVSGGNGGTDYLTFVKQ